MVRLVNHGRLEGPGNSLGPMWHPRGQPRECCPVPGCWVGVLNLREHVFAQHLTWILWSVESGGCLVLSPPPQIAALCALAVYVLGLERRVEGLLGVLGVQSPAEKTLRMGHLAMAILYRALDWQIQEASTLLILPA